MKIVVIGGGVIGVTTAYLLAARGQEVVVVERAAAPALETSFANAALLTPSMSEPWNAPGCWRHLLVSMAQPNAPVQLRLAELPALIPWGSQFLRNSRVDAFERNTRSNMRLALYSLQIMGAIRQRTGIEYGRNTRGILKIFRDPEKLTDAGVAFGKWRAQGLRSRVLDTKEVMALEPGLESIASELAGGIHCEDDESGDAHRFTVALRSCAEKLGVQFRFGTTVRRLETRAGRVVKAICDGMDLDGEQFVIAAGSYSTPLADTVQVRLPVRPVKGYSITCSREPGEQPLGIPVVDDHLHLVVTPLPNVIRVVGMAEFAGYDRTLRAGRLQHLRELLESLLPTVRFNSDQMKPWCGLRAMCVDGVPIIGPTQISNLFINTGHGHLGWTFAAGSAQLLTELICGNPASLDSEPYLLARFN